jgi:hypothetical protein
VALDRQRHAQSQAEAEAPHIPGNRPAPSKDANRPLKEEDVDETLHAEPGAADVRTDGENPAV